MTIISVNWWEQPLQSLNRDQWEALCDGCGKCCLHKLQDEATEKIYFTAVACQFLDQQAIRCNCYRERAERNPDCLVIDPANISELAPWLPLTCAYRLRFFDQALPVWHPLLTGRKDSVEEAGQSVRHRCISENAVQGDTDWEELVLVDMV